MSSNEAGSCRGTPQQVGLDPLLRPLLHPCRRALFEDQMAEAIDPTPGVAQTDVAEVLARLGHDPAGQPAVAHNPARVGDLVASHRPPPPLVIS